MTSTQALQQLVKELQQQGKEVVCVGGLVCFTNEKGEIEILSFENQN